jgi:cytochrome b subunit of formate dehydrogenase
VHHGPSRFAAGIFSVKLSWFIFIVFVFPAWAGKNSPANAKPSNADCLACHNDATLQKDGPNGKPISLYVNEDHFKNSVHSVFSCTDCHSDVKQSPHETTPKKATCAQCHEQAQKDYDHGFHAKAVARGDTQAATCVDCHGSPHETVPSSDHNSKVYRTNIPKTCAACHGLKLVVESRGVSTQPAFSYQESVHGKAVAAGSQKAAVCTDCHGNHDILPPGDPSSSIFKFNVPQTCGKCHEAVKSEFMTSTHGQALTRGNWSAPVCTDCHGIHLIKKHVDPTSSVAAQNLARTTCGQCHESVKLSQEFGIAGRRASTYLASYHGMASQLGSSVVANCASCHGVHNILPSSDPRSMISQQNLAKTCGQCHPGANENFTKGKVHLDNAALEADVGTVVVRWVRKFYLWVIAVVIGGMALHNLIVWRNKAVKQRRQQRRVVERMSRSQRVQHFVLLISFITLVITGFALKFPTSWFARLLGMGETWRSIIHRIAGVVLIGAGAWHVVYIRFSREGRALIKDLLPKASDATGALDVMRYHLGFSSKHPQFGRFGYAEKAEYWALVWGTILMAATGLMAWFKVGVGSVLPRWSIDVALAIHFYEAILATLAIVVWHFYLVMFDPDTYPMNWAWFDGKMSLEQYKREHPLDTTSIRAAEEAAEAERSGSGEAGVTAAQQQEPEQPSGTRQE